MNKQHKKVLSLMAIINKKSQSLFDEKAKLEQKILEIDIKMYDIMKEYDNLLRNVVDEIAK